MEYDSAIKRNEITIIFCNMDGPRNYHAKWNQPYNETPTSNAFTDMWNLKKGQTELLCRTDTDSQTLKNLWFPKETVQGVGRCAGVVGWKSCEIGLWWSLYNYRCDKFIWVIKKKRKKTRIKLIEWVKWYDYCLAKSKCVKLRFFFFNI